MAFKVKPVALDEVMRGSYLLRFASWLNFQFWVIHDHGLLWHVTTFHYCDDDIFTFLSKALVAKTGMWQASSGQQNDAMFFPSSSPHNQPGEFSSPETNKKERFSSFVNKRFLPL